MHLWVLYSKTQLQSDAGNPCLLCFSSGSNDQFQKQGKDVEKVKQRLAEIANYVDKVKSAGEQGLYRQQGNRVAFWELKMNEKTAIFTKVLTLINCC